MLCVMCAGFQFATNNIEEGIGAAKMAQEAGALPTSVLRHTIAPERGTAIVVHGRCRLTVLRNGHIVGYACLRGHLMIILAGWLVLSMVEQAPGPQSKLPRPLISKQQTPNDGD